MELMPKATCWVSVNTDGERVFSGLMNAGDKRLVTAKEQIALNVGDAGALVYTLNGRPGKPLGAPGQVDQRAHHARQPSRVSNTLMDLGLRSPMLDFFKRGEVAKDVRMLAASGVLAPRALEQIGLLAMLTDDGDAEVRELAEATLAAIPNASLAGFLGRSDVPDGLRDFFRARGIEPLAGGDGGGDEPLINTAAEGGPVRVPMKMRIRKA